MYSLLLLSSLLHITTCTVYTVTPDDHYYPNTTCHHCHNLQHYLLNITKYFTSNTQLFFLPGLHHLHTNLIILDAYNISIIGSRAANNKLLDTVIQCNSTGTVDFGISIRNVSIITLQNLKLQNCGKGTIYQDAETSTFIEASIEILSCFNVYMKNIIINGVPKLGIIATNAFDFSLLNVSSKGIKILYEDLNDDYLYSSPILQNYTTLNIDHVTIIYLGHHTGFYYFDPLQFIGRPWYQNYLYFDPSEIGLDDVTISDSQRNEFYPNKFGNSITAITISLLQNNYNVSVTLSNSVFDELSDYEIVTINVENCNNIIKNTVSITRCKFKNNTSSLLISLIHINIVACSSNLTINLGEHIVTFENCLFYDNVYKVSTIKINEVTETLSDSEVYGMQPKMLVHIIGCFFQANDTRFIKFSGTWLQSAILHIENTTFAASFATNKDTAITLSNVKLVFKGPVIFSGITTRQRLLTTNSMITFYGYIEFSNITTVFLIHGSEYLSLNLMENAQIKFTNNKISGYLFYTDSDRKKHLYKFCYFQFYKIKHKTNSFKEARIEIAGEDPDEGFDEFAGSINCKWHQDSLYYGLNPLQVYSKHIVVKFTNDSRLAFPFNTGMLCKCQESYKDCYTNLIEAIYPGQIIKLKISLNSRYIYSYKETLPVSVKVYDSDDPHLICKVSSLLEAEQEVHQNCTEVTFTILSENTQYCKLILYNVDYKFPTVYFITLLKCPAGFGYSALENKCICDHNLNSEPFMINKCDINDQTILRPANSWISATAHSNSYTYHISLHCPFHYCLPHSSRLNFSTTNSQCQFNRSGLLCGHCQQGLSTVFSSSHCQHCSNIYLFLIILIAVVGFIIVLIMFYLNLTVTDGRINGFMLYANIISINSPIFFPQSNTVTPAYTFISLANLDLGIQTCFYNGMDDYAKMWLQLAFPFYLIFIATLIIITSRYSTTIQRLTARRALPVLATLFLLSYTKILRIVSSVLFFYSTITHLPSKHTTLVWSVDANVPLFGVRFTILFIACLILFLILVPFNLILLFTRTLSRFRFVNKFKPLLDTYQGPYKDKYYYWSGLQLLMRAVFFGISSLDRNINLTISIILLGILGGMHGMIRPFKMMYKNYQELVFTLNLQALYAISLYYQDDNTQTIVTIMISMAAIQFTFIITYHMITYVCGGVIRNKILLSINGFTGWITRLQKKSQPQPFQLESNIRNNIPEVAFKYHEFREPLLDQDN